MRIMEHDGKICPKCGALYDKGEQCQKDGSKLLLIGTQRSLVQPLRGVYITQIGHFSADVFLKDAPDTP